MSRYDITAPAKDDLDEIWDYIARDNITAANQLLDQLHLKLALLAYSPGIGRPRDRLLLGLRSFPVGNYLLFYRPIPDGIELVRVLHGARDLPVVFPR